MYLQPQLFSVRKKYKFQKDLIKIKGIAIQANLNVDSNKQDWIDGLKEKTIEDVWIVPWIDSDAVAVSFINRIVNGVSVLGKNPKLKNST